jgi:hypothetical protein
MMKLAILEATMSTSVSLAYCVAHSLRTGWLAGDELVGTRTMKRKPTMELPTYPAASVAAAAGDLSLVLKCAKRTNRASDQPLICSH